MADLLWGTKTVSRTRAPTPLNRCVEYCPVHRFVRKPLTVNGVPRVDVGHGHGLLHPGDDGWRRAEDLVEDLLDFRCGLRPDIGFMAPASLRNAGSW
jgi:hypothetical protein